MSTKKLRWITPTLAQIFSTQLKKLMDGIDTGQLKEAFCAAHTLVSAIKKKERATLKKKYVFPIVEQLENVGCSRHDFFVSGVVLSKQTHEILMKNIRPLHEAIMDVLYDGGYLEALKKVVASNVPVDSKKLDKEFGDALTQPGS